MTENLKQIYDPEIPMNIVDLGLIYGFEWSGDDVTLKMTLTAPGCPVAGILAEEVKNAIEKVPNDLEFAPALGERASEEGFTYPGTAMVPVHHNPQLPDVGALRILRSPDSRNRAVTHRKATTFGDGDDRLAGKRLSVKPGEPRDLVRVRRAGPEQRDADIVLDGSFLVEEVVGLAYGVEIGPA